MRVFASTGESWGVQLVFRGLKISGVNSGFRFKV